MWACDARVAGRLLCGWLAACRRQQVSLRWSGCQLREYGAFTYGHLSAIRSALRT